LKILKRLFSSQKRKHIKSHTAKQHEAQQYDCLLKLWLRSTTSNKSTLLIYGSEGSKSTKGFVLCMQRTEDNVIVNNTSEIDVFSNESFLSKTYESDNSTKIHLTDRICSKLKGIS
jgi:hypothetical protein